MDACLRPGHQRRQREEAEGPLCGNEISSTYDSSGSTRAHQVKVNRSFAVIFAQ
jgi:hypothetical protein